MPSFTWNEVLPVIVSICVIIAIAILKKYSDSFAAVAATMPINIPLGMWVFMAGRENDNEALTNFTGALFMNMMPTLLFIVAAWLILRSGGNLISAVIIGYIVWAISLALLYAARNFFGF
jgi:hypothetical protein